MIGGGPYFPGFLPPPYIHKMLFLLFLIVAAITAAAGIQPGLIITKATPGFVHAADPNAFTVNGTLYVFSSRDPPNANKKTRFKGMRDYVLFTHNGTAWTNYGIILDPLLDFPQYKDEFTKKSMFAPGAIYRHGYFYLYFPYVYSGMRSGNVGVAKSATPHIRESWKLVGLMPDHARMFDPAIMVDPKTDLVYVFANAREKNTYRNPLLRGILNEDMFTVQNAALARPFSSNNYVSEGVFAFERKGKYYVIARDRGRIVYWMLNSPDQTVGPVKGGGKKESKPLTPNQKDSPAHASVAEFQGKWYIFYHTGRGNGGNYFRRSACVDEIFFNENGTIQPLKKFTCAYKK